MIHLLSDEGRHVLRAVAVRPVLYAFDFDGTLAPISAERDAVRVSRTMSEWLQELSKRSCCAVVSGRALADLAPRINGAVPHLIGNHGIEGPLSTQETLLRAEEVCTDWKRQMVAEAAALLAALGAEVEDKRYSLTVHVRGARDAEAACRQTLPLLRRLTPAPQLIMGKYSINVLPPGQGGKGPATLALMVHLRRSGLFFIGDDETDESVFAMTEGLTLGVRVGKQAGSHAKYFLNHPGEVEEVIRFLVHRMDRTPEDVDPDGRMSTGARSSKNS
ncbi:MAG: trehalose-phosphatase [Nitrospira sp. CR1.3]|nr:trehalose-phosphatase [Nitrospira sp. CR1.3]